MSVSRCAHCDAASTPLTCKGCHVTRYCSGKCASVHWDTSHHEQCAYVGLENRASFKKTMRATPVIANLCTPLQRPKFLSTPEALQKMIAHALRIGGSTITIGLFKAIETLTDVLQNNTKDFVNNIDDMEQLNDTFQNLMKQFKVFPFTNTQNQNRNQLLDILNNTTLRVRVPRPRSILELTLLKEVIQLISDYILCQANNETGYKDGIQHCELLQYIEKVVKKLFQSQTQKLSPAASEQPTTKQRVSFKTLIKAFETGDPKKIEQVSILELPKYVNFIKSLPDDVQEIIKYGSEFNGWYLPKLHTKSGLHMGNEYAKKIVFIDVEGYISFVDWWTTWLPNQMKIHAVQENHNATLYYPNNEFWIDSARNDWEAMEVIVNYSL